jgi:polyhydroxyalkanoate synthesis regulator phasin
MADVLKKAFLAGLGAVSLSQERTREIVDELIKVGKLKEKDGEKIFKELMAKATVAKKDVESKVSQQVISSVGKLNLAALEQLKKLERRIQELEKSQAKPGKKTTGAKKKTSKR